jgi:hypothetical protein
LVRSVSTGRRKAASNSVSENLTPLRPGPAMYDGIRPARDRRYNDPGDMASNFAASFAVKSLSVTIVCLPRNHADHSAQ